MINKKNVLICGFPNTVLRIFIESLSERYNIYFISYSKKFQYSKIKETLGENAFLIDIESTKNVLRKFYNVFRLVLMTFEVISNKKTKSFIAYHNHFIKNGIIMLMMKWFFPKVNRIYFPYDIISYGLPKELKYKNKSRLSFFFDKICFERSDKIITKGFEDELIYLKGMYRIHTKPHLAFNFLIEKKDLVNKNEGTFSKDQNHLVFIGGISNSEWGDNNYKVFERLLKEKNIFLHVYSHSSGILKNLQHNKNLLVHNYITEHGKLIKEISKYDFGIILSSPSQYDFIQLKMSSGIRFYDYLTAGLPIIIDDKHDSMANMAINNNFGIVIPLDQIENIAHFIGKCDYNSLISSIKKNREKFLAENHANKLITFIEK
ncbi:MAG: hypothetical protein K8R68_07950 [Bacteroidales bacterium]|nr:hypothetical protein [Bacteroidales bacterium]